MKQKPGFITPDVALQKKGTKESIEAEKLYLKEREENPLFTDLKYFFMAIQNCY